MTVGSFFQAYEADIRLCFEQALIEFNLSDHDVSLTVMADPYTGRKSQFSVYLPNGPVRITWAGIASLWTFCQSAVRIVGEIEAAEKTGATALLLEGDARIGADLAELSRRLITQDMHRPEWVDWTPKPDRSSRNAYAKIGDKLFFAALAWIMRHELAHIALNHLRVPDQIAAENDADAMATRQTKGYRKVDPNRPLSSAPGEEELDLEFLALAIGVGLAWISEFERPLVETSATHPPVAERLERCFRILDLKEDSGAEKWVADILRVFDLLFKDSEGEASTYQNSADAFSAALSVLYSSKKV